MNEYTVTISKEIIYTTKIHAANWEDACDLAEHEFDTDPSVFEEVETNFEVVDYQITVGEEQSGWSSE